MSYRKPTILDQSALFGLAALQSEYREEVPYRIMRETCLRTIREISPEDAAFLVSNVEQVYRKLGVVDLLTDLIEWPHESTTLEKVQEYGAAFYAELRKLRGPAKKKPGPVKSNIIQFAPYLAAKRKRTAA